VYNNPVYHHALALYPKENIVRGMLTLLVMLDHKFNLHEETKTPKDLLKFDAKLSSDANSVLSNLSLNKAKRMRTEIFKTLKRVQELKVLAGQRMSPNPTKKQQTEPNAL
jgi:hypothetical protein